MKKRRPYWIKFHVGECPVCGRDASWKERVYGKKPKRVSLRHVSIPYALSYDHCQD